MCYFLMFVGHELEQALRRVGRFDLISKCMYNIEEVTAFAERAAARVRMDAGFHELRDELGSSRSSTIPRDTSLDVSFEEQDFVKAGKHELIN